MKVRIYTDGACSKNPGPGGWAALFTTDTKIITLKGSELNTTNNRMELIAVIESYKKILELNEKGKTDLEYEIFSDSAYVVNAINGCWIEKWMLNDWKTSKGEVRNQDLWIEFYGLKIRAQMRKIPVIVTKVKGHSGNSFNDMADKIAKEQSNNIQEDV